MAVSLLVAALAGCTTTGGNASDDAPIGSPQWKAGQFWELASSYRDVGERTGEDARTIDEQGNSTVRMQVLAPDIETKRGVVALVLSNYTDSDGDADEWLGARVPGNFSSYGLEPWTALTCSEADLCLPPIAGTLHGTAHGLLEFPLHVGKTWSYDDPENPGSGWEARVVGLASFQAPAGTLPSYVIHVHTHYEERSEDDGRGFTFWQESNVTAHYAPSVGYFAALESVGRSRFQDIEDGREVSATRLQWTSQTVLRRTGVESAPTLDDVVQRLGLGATPPSGSIPGDVSVRIDEHPEMFDNGTAWTFHASASDLGDLELRWQLVLRVLGNETLVQEGTGAAFDARFTQPGAYLVEAFAVNADGQRVGSWDEERVGARLRLSGTGTCEPGVSTAALEDDTTCTGLTFTVPAGIFVLRGEAVFATGESVLPCAHLAFYRDGAEVGRNYIGSGQDATFVMQAAEEVAAPWELRWVPSASVGSTVSYAVVVEPVGSSGLPGLNGGC